MHCISVPILDDINVLEMEAETFEVVLTSFDSAVTFPLGQRSVIVTINEDTMDGRYTLISQYSHANY